MFKSTYQSERDRKKPIVRLAIFYIYETEKIAKKNVERYHQ